jgi:capsular polysaccharide biosynthesis protein
VELRHYLTILQGRVWLIVAAALLAGSAGYGISNKPPAYVARATLYVGSRSISLEPGSGELSNDRATAIDRLVLTFSFMVDSEPIARRAAEEIGLERPASDIVKATEALPQAATQLLYIDVTDPDPAVAQDLANGLADAFVEAVQEFEPGDLEGAVPRLPAYIYQQASLPTAPKPTDAAKTVMLAVLFGLLASSGIVFLLDYLNLTIRSVLDAERRLELPVLGVIPALGAELPVEHLNLPASSRGPMARAAAHLADPGTRERSDA